MRQNKLTPDERHQRKLQRQRAYREKHRDELRAKDREYYAKNRIKVCERHARNYKKFATEHPDLMRKQTLEAKRRNPQIIPIPVRRARYLAQKQIPITGKCEKCGSTEKLQRHHLDYSKPLDVKILCASCHTLSHIGIRRN